MSDKINELEYPFYITDLTRLRLKQDCKINPYDEFMHFCCDNYYEKIEKKFISLGEFFSMDENPKIALLNSILEPFNDSLKIYIIKEKDVQKSKEINVIKIDDKDGNNLISLYENSFKDLVVNFKYVSSSNGVLKITFKDNKIFDYLVEEPSETNVYYFNEVPEELIDNNFEYNNQFDLAMCICAGLVKYSDYVKFHKINSIKINSISSYIGTKDELKDKIIVDYNYNDAYVTYIDDSLEEGFSIYVINYKTYANDIDKMFEKILK